MFSADGSQPHKFTVNRGWLLPALVLLALLLSYGPSLDGPLFFDDEPNLLDNPLVQLDGRAFDEWRLAVLSNDSGLLHRPVAMFTFALNYFVAGNFSAFGLKSVNLMLHIINGVLIYALAAALLRSPAVAATRAWSAEQRHLVALGAASLWLLHPLHVSSVLYAVQRMALLSTLFTLAGLYLFARFRLRWAERGTAADGGGELVAAVLWLAILGLLAILSKENGALLPWLVLVLEVTLFQGVWAGRRSAALARLSWLALLLPALLLAAAALWAPDSLPGTYKYREFSLEERVLTQGRALWLYLGWLAVPDITQMGFFHDDIPVSRAFWSPLTTGLSLIAWSFVLLFCLTAFRRYPLLAFAFLFYLVGHSMESTVIPLELVFEHRNYLPATGFAILLAAIIMQLTEKADSLRYIPVVCLLALLLAGLLALRSQAWGDMVTLARHNVVNHPDSPRANFYYALTLMEELGRSQREGGDAEREGALAVAARSHFLRMHELDPLAISATVMLFQLDTKYFPSAAREQDWLVVMERQVAQKRLHASDFGAIGSLVSFAGELPEPAVRERVLHLLTVLYERYPNREMLVEDLYQAHMIAGGSREDMLPFLQRTAGLSKGSTRAASHLVAYHVGHDTAAAYDALLEWVRRDTLRRELPVIRKLLEP